MNEILKQLIKNSPLQFSIKEYKKDMTIFYENEKCKNIALIIKGKIKISSYTNFGNEIIYSIINEGNFFGNHLVFSNQNLYRGNVICLENTTIGFINENDFLNLLSSNNVFLKYYLSYQSEQVKALNAKIKILSLSDAEERFLYYLSINNNKITYSSITSLANEINLRRETLSRLISTLLSENKIIKVGKTITKIKN